MNKKLLAAIMIFCAFIVSTAALAHPPKSVSLTWNSNGSLAVNVVHQVNDPQKHYIERIVIYVDDKIVQQREYSSQPNVDGLTDTFNIGQLAAGSVIKAEAFCIIMGSVTGSTTAN